jgi:hypothetical protein
MNLEKIYVSQKAHVKTELGYMEANSPPMFKNVGNLKER